MIRRHPAMLAALMLCALPSREPTPEEQRERTLKKLRTDLAREGESPEEVARITAALDLEAMEIAGVPRSEQRSSEPRIHFDESTPPKAEVRPATTAMTAREAADAANRGELPGVDPLCFQATFPIEQATGRTMTEVNRERRARGELGTKRQRKARRR